MNAIYCRVSTDEQAKTGYSLEDQLNTCRAKLSAMGIAGQIEQFIDDGYSGEFIERPAMDSIRDKLRNKSIENIIVYDPDRLARNLTHMLLIADEIQAAGANLIFCTHNYDVSPEGKLFFSIRGAIAAFEKAKIRERTMRGKRQKALQGKLTFNDKPFGYDWLPEICNYSINEPEARVIRTMFDLYANQSGGVRAVAEELRRQGFRNREGKWITPTHVYRMLKSEMYCGTKWAFQNYEPLIGQGKKKKQPRPREEWIAIDVPAIVSRDLWEKAQQSTTANTNTSIRNVRYKYLLRNMVKCSCCGYAMIGNSSGEQYQYYVCSRKLSYASSLDKLHCDSRHIRIAQLDEYVWGAVLDLANGHTTLPALMHSDEIDHGERILELESQNNGLIKSRDDYRKWLRQSIITAEEFEQEMAIITREQSAIQSALSELKQSQDKIKKQVNIDPAKILNAVTFDERREVMLDMHRSGVTIHAKKGANDVIHWRFILT